MNRIKKAYAKVSPQSYEGKLAAAMKDTLEERLRLFTDGVNAASYNLRNTTKSSTVDGRVKNQIRITEDGKQYVYADRQVIKGNDSSKWGNQVTNYINEKIRDGEDVVVYAQDGDALTITRDTAGKAQFRNYVITKEGQKRLMTDEEYAVKLRAETHIDELSKASKKGNRTVPDTKSHSFAKDGFNYRTAYFMDFDGSYYRLTLSVGKNESVNTVYNVGKIKETERPDVAQRPNRVTTAEDELISVSNLIISDSSENINTQNRKNQSRSSTDSDYLTAVERGDMETAQRMVDEAAKAAGYTIKVYHQTAKDFTVFNTDNPKAGLNDSETPNGIFFKTNDHDIGLDGKKQMPAYLSISNLLDFKDRSEANIWYRKNIERYEMLDDEMKREVKKIDDRMNRIENDMFRDDITDKEYEKLSNQWDTQLEEMRTKENGYRGRLRNLLNDYFLNDKSSYDGIHLGYDGHRYVNGKRENVETYIVFKNTQVKSADPVTYDDNGDVIPLSERFNPKQKDIRFQNRNKDYSDSLSDSEWTVFNRTIIGDNQYASNKIGKTGVYLYNSNKLIVYNGKKYDPQIKAVYNLGDYEYNIHDGIDNIAERFINELEVFNDEERAETVLQKYSSIYGTVFKRYEPKSYRYVELTRSGYSDRAADRQRAAGAGVSERAEQTRGVKNQSRPDADLFEESQWLDLDDDVSLLTHHFENNNRAIGEVLRKTAAIPVGIQDLRRRVKKVLLKYGLPVRRQ